MAVTPFVARPLGEWLPAGCMMLRNPAQGGSSTFGALSEHMQKQRARTDSLVPNRASLRPHPLHACVHGRGGGRGAGGRNGSARGCRFKPAAFACAQSMPRTCLVRPKRGFEASCSPIDVHLPRSFATDCPNVAVTPSVARPLGEWLPPSCMMLRIPA